MRAAKGVGDLLAGQKYSSDARLSVALAAATLPAVIAGFILKATGWHEHLRSVEVIAWTTLIFGLFLLGCDRLGSVSRKAADWSIRDAWILGSWQVLALIPGTSRSGIVISGARMLGYGRTDCARLAMLMSIPVIAASGSLLGAEAVVEASAAAVRDGAIAVCLAFLSALAALSIMMRLLRTVSYTPYVVYRIFLGAGLLWIVYA